MHRARRDRFALAVVLLVFPVSARAWGVWPRDSRLAQIAVRGGTSPPPPPLPSPDRVYDYNGLDAAVARHGNVDAEALWGELQARARLSACWKQMLVDLKAKCGTVRGNNDLRSRLALGMASCDAEADGRMSSVFVCASRRKVQRCVQSLSEVAYSQFVQYRLHADSLCTYLEAEIYQERTEVAMAALRGESAATVQTLRAVQSASDDVRAQLAAAARQQEKQALTALAVQAQLRAIEESQGEALIKLRASAAVVTNSSAQTAASLAALRESMAQAASGAAHAVEALGAQTRTYFESLEGHTAGLLRTLGRLEKLQNVLVEQMFSAQDGARGVLGVLLVLVLTSFSHTAPARWPAVALVGASVVLPVMMGWGARLRVVPGVPPLAVSGLGIVAALVLVAVVYVHSSSAETQRHALFREEVERGVEQTVQRVAQLLHEATVAQDRGVLTPPWTPYQRLSFREADRLAPETPPATRLRDSYCAGATSPLSTLGGSPLHDAPCALSPSATAAPTGEAAFNESTDTVAAVVLDIDTDAVQVTPPATPLDTPSTRKRGRSRASPVRQTPTKTRRRDTPTATTATKTKTKKS